VLVCVSVFFIWDSCAGGAVTVARKDRAGAATKGLNPLVCNFGDVKIGSSCMHAVTLHNHSNSTAFYQFQV
jgi:hypothetical protein